MLLMNRTDILLTVLIIVTIVNTVINYVWFTLC